MRFIWQVIGAVLVTTGLALAGYYLCVYNPNYERIAGVEYTYGAADNRNRHAQQLVGTIAGVGGLLAGAVLLVPRVRFEPAKGMSR